MRSHPLLFVWIVVSFLACGETTDPPEGEAGKGGGHAGSGGMAEGGSGGDGSGGGGTGGGGAGGAGATGGAEAGSGGSVEPFCGDERLDRDRDEECDDGNQKDNDGCSSTCRIEGTCDLPIDWMEIAELDPDGSVFILDVFKLPHTGEPSKCGGSGRQLVFRYVPPESGLLFVAMNAGVPATISLRQDICEDSDAQVLCTLNSIQVNHRVEAGEEFFLLVDSKEPVDELELFLGTLLVPYKQEGERCSFQDGLLCEPGLTCDDVRNKGTCVPNAPPVLNSLLAYRGGPSGDDLFVVVQAGDVNGNIQGAIQTRFFAPDGSPVLVYDSNRDGTPDTFQQGFPFGISLLGQTSVDVTATGTGFFAGLPAIATVEAWIMDTEKAVSNVVSVPITPQPSREEGEACDLRRHRDMCAEGLICFPATGGPVCRVLEEVREERCLTAPVITVGADMEARFPDLTVPDQMSLWDAPHSCIDKPSKGSQLNQVEGIARLRLTEPLYNVVISTQAPTSSPDTVLYLLPGCGATGEVLACNDDDSPTKIFSRIALDSLDEGEYLLVVDRRVQQGTHWNLKVTGTPEP